MATKIGNARKPKAAVQPVASDLEILHPERTITLGIGPVTVREYGGIEWLRLLPKAAPLVDAIAAKIETGGASGYDDTLTILAKHVDELLPLVAQAADLDMAQVETLGAADMELLLLTWWSVCGHFFVERALTRVLVERQEKLARARSAGVSYTPPSSPTVTEPESLDITPTVN